MLDFTERLALARCAHDRDDAGRRSVEFGRNPAQLVCILSGERALCQAGANPTLDLRPVAEVVEGMALATTDAIYLGKLPTEGVHGGGPEVFAVSVDGFTAESIEPDSTRWCELRQIATQLSDLDVGLFAQALAMRNFHTAHAYSSADGSPNTAQRGGWVLTSDRSGARTFPRTDPAIIVGVIDRDDRILLGANARWQPKRYSAFAGFVEPGESLEDAARREVFEEAGARITNLRYLGSQPWPFPASLMVAFMAQLDEAQDPGTVQGDGEEIIEVRWFSRDEIVEIVDRLPSSEAIARVIIEQWYGGPIPQEQQ